jgi:DNA-binding CsgD family transcriptional regulator
MSLISNKSENAGNDSGDSLRNWPQMHIMDDSQWLFIRKSFRMSPRELDIAKLVCSGFSNDEIASRRGISIATVKTHLRNIYRRIRVQRKLDMLLTFLEKSSEYANLASNTTIAVVESKVASNSGLSEIGGQEEVINR